MYCSWDSDRIGGNGGFPIGKKNIHRRYTEYYKMTELIVSCVTVCGPGWRHSPHAGVLQDTHDPLNPVHGHTLLETAESWKKKKVVPWATGAVLTAGAVESAKHMGCVKCVCVCEGIDSLPLWPGSVGSHKVRVWQRSQAVFRACLNVALSSRDPYNACQTTHKQQLLYWRLCYSMLSLASAKQLIYKLFSNVFCNS